ncbi:MAG: hypothetical protein HRT68_05140 [Flavobacteriaceae bacterium]|nr:hypothetical protein [Flavobacteriaceae bacterium]
MKKLYFLIPIVVTVIIVSRRELGVITLREMEQIDLSTLLFVFPIILALIERFNELFVVKKSNDDENDGTTQRKATNFRWALMASFTIGILLAIAGFRILETFIVPPSVDGQMYVNVLFRSLDCILTGTVIAGGTEGWHQIISLISDMTKAKRKELKENQPS